MAGSFAAAFRSTRWSVVRLASGGSGSQASESMDRLARSYWYPLYAFARRQGMKEADAQDATQGFLARFVTGSYLESAAPSKGRFRSYLLVCFKNYLSDERERAQAQKRGGGMEFVPLDASVADEQFRNDPVGLNIEDHYDLDWARSLMAELLERLRSEYQRTQKLDRYEALLPFLDEDPSQAEQERLRQALGLAESGLRSALQRLRFRFGEYLWTEIARTVTDVSEVEQETRHLLEMLCRTDFLRSAKSPGPAAKP